MASTYTASKNLEKMGSGDHSGTWDSPLNSNYDIIEKALSGQLNITLGSTTYAMTQAEAQNAVITLNGTLTANVTITIPNSITGHWIIYNGTTGSFTVSFKNVSSGSPITIQQGRATLAFSDGTNCGFGQNADVGTATSATNATNAVNLVNSTNQTMTPYGVNGYTITAPTGQTSVWLKVIYNAVTVGGYLYADSFGMSFQNGSGTATIHWDGSGNFTSAGGMTDSKGNLRTIPPRTITGSDTAVIADVGKYIKCTSSAAPTVPASVFSDGDVYSYINLTGGSITITQGTSLTLTQGGTTNTGNRTLAANGVATILFTSGTAAVISGSGLS